MAPSVAAGSGLRVRFATCFGLNRVSSCTFSASGAQVAKGRSGYSAYQKAATGAGAAGRESESFEMHGYAFNSKLQSFKLHRCTFSASGAQVAR